MIKPIILSCILGLFCFNLYGAEDLDFRQRPIAVLTCESKIAPTKINTKFCDLYLSATIEEPNFYWNVSREIRPLNPQDTLMIHLAGNGGSVEGLIYLLNAIKYSKVKTIGSLEGSVASAHTALLISCDEIKLAGNGYLLFHAISWLNMTEDICAQRTGKDRGIANYTKCVENSKTIGSYYASIFDKYSTKYLTKEEIKKYYEGHDIILTSEEFKQRLKKGVK